METTSVDVFETFRTRGSQEAFDALEVFVRRPARDWGKKDLQSLERWAVGFGAQRAWPHALLCWCVLLTVLTGAGEEEKRAYFFDDLGTALLLILDRRCFDCFYRALRLAKSPGRRMRTLQLCGDAAAIVTRDYAKARRFYRAAYALGRRYRLGPAKLSELRDQIEELERWNPGGKPLHQLSFAPGRSEAVRRDIDRQIDPRLVAMVEELDVTEFDVNEGEEPKKPSAPATAGRGT